MYLFKALPVLLHSGPLTLLGSFFFFLFLVDSRVTVESDEWDKAGDSAVCATTKDEWDEVGDSDVNTEEDA